MTVYILKGEQGKRIVQVARVWSAGSEKISCYQKMGSWGE